MTQEDLPVKYIQLSDHLDMLGVKLKASYCKIRKVNCDEIREKFANLIGGWRGGRYMSLSQRPLSINSYALPIIWYKCHSIELREGDFAKLTSTAKSWLFADCLEKPEELVTFKSRDEGGLGLHHIRSKSLAILIKSFLETAVGSKFIHNNYHHTLFNWHVLFQTESFDPGRPPYYSNTFFATIREVMLRGDLDKRIRQ